MADVKRNPPASKVATPKTSANTTPQPTSTPSSSITEALSKALGSRIKITLATPTPQPPLEGTLYTVSRATNLLMLNTRPSTTGTAAGDYRTIPLSRVQNFHILSLGSAQSPPVIEEQRLESKLSARVKALKEEKEDRPKGVSKEAQAIFDAFKRINMPVRWHSGSIIVHEAVIISPPFRVEDCRGPNEKREAVTQVKKALEGEKRKMREREEREERERKAGGAAAGAAAQGQGQRKGG